MVKINKGYRLLSMVLVFTMLFSFLPSNVSFADDDDENNGTALHTSIWNWITNPVGEALRLLEIIFTGLLLALGDGALTLLSQAVGESVTIDRVIYGDISKVSVDFWKSGSGGGITASLKDTVVSWFNTFTAIATVIYLTILLIIGIQIAYSSTGSSMAKYKSLLMDWVIGVALLFIFPYVMRIAVQANGALAKAAKEAAHVSAQENIVVSQSDEDSILKTIGGNKFVEAITGKEKPDASDGMMYIRYLAGEQGRIPLAVVYLIMVVQLIIILFVYYKRVFMVAFLITIFPLVAVTFTMDKLGGGVTRTQAFGHWLKEFLLNVFMQAFHAVTYAVIVQAGITAFSSTQNWFFLILCTTFLFQGERLLRKIFNLGSSFGTLKDLGETGAAVWGVSRVMGKGIKR